ncbi:MAG: DUF4290 domain-containing protein [Bacteroidia bacterium]
MSEISHTTRDSKYHVSSEPLMIREYGRNIQNMIKFCKTIEDKEYRSRVAKEIVRMMVDLNPAVKEDPEYEQKLWDHLFVISEFDLDVEAPYPVPAPEDDRFKKPKRMTYHQVRPRKRQYGHNIQLMVQKAMEIEDKDIQKRYLSHIAYTMKQFLRGNEKEALPHEILAAHITEISGGKLQVSPDDLDLPRNVRMKAQPSNLIHHTTRQKKRNNKKKKKSNNSNNNNRRRRR